MKEFLSQKNKGFTLVETLVAVSIFTLSILGLLSILTQGIASTGYAKKKLTAAYLAQEGIEFMRNQRDTSVLYNTSGPQAGWTSFILRFAICNTARGCYYNPDNINFSDSSEPVLAVNFPRCPVGGCPVLLHDPATGRYGYTPGWVNSGYVRKIQVVFTSANALKITSTVSWTQGTGNYQMSFSETLLNWVE